MLNRNRADVPFALIYIRSDDRTHLALAGAVGLEMGTPTAPAVVALNAESVANAAEGLAIDRRRARRRLDASHRLAHSFWCDAERTLARIPAPGIAAAHCAHRPGATSQSLRRRRECFVAGSIQAIENSWISSPG